MLRYLTPTIAMTGAALLTSCSSTPALSPSQSTLITAMRSHGVSDTTLKARDDGGVVVDAKLAGRPFSLVVPRRWNGQALLFAHGYTTPGTSVAVPKDPVAQDISIGMLPRAYADGFAVGLSSFDKAGIGVESATINTKALRDALVASGTRRVYVAGGSMGGSIVMSLIDHYPGAFAGAISACGVTDGWETQFEHMVDMRVAYDVLTAGTPYALPGRHDATRDALSPGAGWPGLPGDIFRYVQLRRLSRPIFKLFDAAKADPNGREARIIRQVSEISGYQPEVASFVFTLTTVSLGMNDMIASYGGLIYGNRGKVYAATSFSPSEAATLNRTVQRFDADPAAVARAREWHRSTGRSQTPLLTFHNRIDALVPFTQATALRARLRAAGNTHAVQFVAPATIRPLPFGGVSGYTHCGFNPAQTSAAWEAMRNWVEKGAQPKGKIDN